MAIYGRGFNCAIVAGFFGAAASLFSKFTMGSLINEIFHKIGLSSEENYYAIVMMRLVCFGLSLMCNALMWTTFSKSLQSLSSLAATIINSSSNLFLIAILGWFLLEEKLNTTWFIGSVLIITGLVVMNICSDDSLPKDKERAD